MDPDYERTTRKIRASILGNFGPGPGYGWRGSSTTEYNGKVLVHLPCNFDGSNKDLCYTKAWCHESRTLLEIPLAIFMTVTGIGVNTTAIRIQSLIRSWGLRLLLYVTQ